MGPFKLDTRPLFHHLVKGFKGPIKRGDYLNYAGWVAAGLEDDARDFLKHLLNWIPHQRLGSYVSGRRKTGWWVFSSLVVVLH
jgi:hypothetical protein